MWIWGHHSTFDKYWFNSHGKIPPSIFRIAFPDLTFLWYSGMSSSEIRSKMTNTGRILENLVYNDLTLNEIKTYLLDIDMKELLIDLSLLLALGYVIKVNNKFRLGIPVFTRKDYEAVLSCSRKIMEEIASRFKERISNVEEYYRQSTPYKNKIPLKEAFNGLYHLIFDNALCKLIGDNTIPKPAKRVDNGEYSVFMVIL